MDNKINCYSPQCGYWNENDGCSIDSTACNGHQICDKGEERYEYRIFAVVEGGRITGVYSDNPEIYVEILDLGNADYEDNNENASSDMRKRIENIETKYHNIFRI